MRISSSWLAALVSLNSLLGAVSAKDILKLSDFQDCAKDADIKLNSVDVEYDADTKTIDFSIDGSSSKSEKVRAILTVQAYGKTVYTKDFNPCDESTLVTGLCPVPVGRFNASSTQTIPSEFADKIPSIAFSVPDIALQATLELKRIDDNTNAGCVVADLSNGKSIDSSAITYAAAGIVAGALAISGVASLVTLMQGGAGQPGESISPSPSFTTVVGWFQSICTMGMLSVEYPKLYQSFTTRFAFATGIVPWDAMQNSIDDFRSRTGGTVATETVTNTTSRLMVRQSQAPIGNVTTVLGIDKWVQETGIVQENTFMTIFLITMIILAAIIVFILLFKVILEGWALFGNFPKSLIGFRKHYWGSILRTVVMLINLIFPIWVLYSIYQFRQSDSWAATLIAAVTLALFAATLVFFIVRIINTARKQIKLTGSASRLFEDKEVWIKYSLFYDNLKKDFWWFFAAYLLYNVLRNTLLAALQGKGLAQTASILTCDVAMFVLMCFLRPYEHKAENIVHGMIQAVRVLSMGCILVFVDELKVERSTQTVMGFALVIATSVLTVILVGLMIFNGIYQCVKSNPHRKRRKEAEKLRNETEYFLHPQHPKGVHDFDHSDDTSYRSPAIMEEGRRKSYFVDNTTPLNQTGSAENARLMGNERGNFYRGGNDAVMSGGYRDEPPRLPTVNNRI